MELLSKRRAPPPLPVSTYAEAFHWKAHRREHDSTIAALRNKRDEIETAARPPRPVLPQSAVGAPSLASIMVAAAPSSRPAARSSVDRRLLLGHGKPDIDFEHREFKTATDSFTGGISNPDGVRVTEGQLRALKAAQRQAESDDVLRGRFDTTYGRANQHVAHLVSDPLKTSPDLSTIKAPTRAIARSALHASDQRLPVVDGKAAEDIRQPSKALHRPQGATYSKLYTASG